MDEFLENSGKWKEEFQELRQIILECGLNETVKWGKPCYTYSGKNILLIHGFKDYCAILFMKGALLEDTSKLLIQQTKNVQAPRQLRFTDTQQISRLRPTIKTYVFEAVENEKAGLKITLKKTNDFKVPEEFQKKLDTSKELATAFSSLTPGRQRAYILYFASAKQSKTRSSRIEKYLPNILNRKGIHDL